MNIWKKIYGIINGALRLGAQGPTIQNNAGKFEVRDSTGSGAATLDVDKAVQRQQDIVATDTKATNITMQTGAATDIPFALPNSKGNAGDSFKTDGNGNLYWDTENDEGVHDFPFTFGSAATINLVDMPNNYQIDKIVIEVTTPFIGGAASLIAVGIAGTTNKFLDTADSALSLTGIFEISVQQLQVAAAQMIATFTVGGSTAGAGRIVVYGSVPK